MATGTILEVVMPQMGVSVSEGTVTRWLKNVGDTVIPDEPLLEISTDKVDTEVPSPGGGVLQEILVPEGETVAVGALLARIGAGSASPLPEPPRIKPEPAPEPAEPEPAEPESAEPELATELAEPEPPPVETDSRLAGVEAHQVAASSEPPAAGEDGHSFVSPVVARMAAEHGIDLSTVAGSGNGGRVTKKDLRALIEHAPDDRPEPERSQQPADAAPAAPPASPPAAAPELAPPAAARPATAAPARPAADEPLEPGETLEPMNIMRRGIAEHMRRSLDTAAHVTSAIEVDATKLVAIRERVKGEYVASYGVSPTYLAFVARATVATLADWPWINAELRGDAVLTRSHVNLGFAVALESGKGLIVPVLRHAEGLNLLGMARGIADLAERARTRKLLPDDVQGGTFTITNPGGFGTLLGTPVINQPQSAILGTYAIVKRPWVVADDEGADAIAIRSIMNLTLTYDHRLVDGAYAAQFLRDLRGRLESWSEADY